MTNTLTLLGVATWLGAMGWAVWCASEQPNARALELMARHDRAPRRATATPSSRQAPSVTTPPALAPTAMIEPPASAAIATDVPGGAIEQAPAPAGESAEPAFSKPPDAEVPAAHADPDVVMFDGRPLRKVRTIAMVVTAYSPDARSCGRWADGVTASGYSVWTNGMKLVAADTRLLPFNTIVTVPGYNRGRPVQVLDRGGKIKGHRLDVLYPTHEIAVEWGVRRLEVDIWEYADE